MEIKLLLGVNLEALPFSIREEFEKIELKFQGNKIGVLRIDEVFDRLSTLKLHNKLYENTSTDEEEQVYSLLSDKRYAEFQQEYSKGFLKGYERNPQQNNLFHNEDNSIIVQRVFSGIYKTFDTLNPLIIPFDEYEYLATGTPFKSDNKTFLCIDLHFYEYGERVGEFVKCWDIILNHSVLFEEIFNKKFEYPSVDEIVKVLPEPIPLIDFSDAKGTEKIVMLQQLGILDFLKNQQPFMQSTNKLAEVISGFTGEKAETIQSYINPMNNPTTAQKNNPMTKQMVVSKINQKLISIGYTPPE